MCESMANDCYVVWELDNRRKTSIEKKVLRGKYFVVKMECF